VRSRSLRNIHPAPRHPLLGVNGIGVNRRFEARGKFFFAGSGKVLLRAVSYGPFAPRGDGSPFSDAEAADRDLALMEELGANALRTFTVPPRWLLDLAAVHRLRVIVGIPWAQHLCFLDSPVLIADTRATIADAVRQCREHPAVAAYLVGNEIPPDIVRWYGPQRITAFLRELVDLVRDFDPGTLVGYANFPSTEYLETGFTDFLAFNVYLHGEAEFRRYLSRLHTLAGDRPLVLTEFGMDSIREGEATQAATLSWQVPAAFEMGVAGTCVFAFTDEWFRGGQSVSDWAFGLVDRERRKKPAFHAVQRCYLEPGPPLPPDPPRVSVVVCAYNAETTLDACLTSLEGLRYPDYEVIVVNDGSTDNTGPIAESYPRARVIHQDNRGLSAARNVGIAAAAGEIVAFTDSDCVVDPDWLTYLVGTLGSSGFPAVGGPNLPPPEDSLVASCVAAAPGGPLHVLLNDEEAEHVPGCNMAFRRKVLEEIGGFDPLYRAAGDDVDVCWRLQDRGHRIGFSPAAMVWHFRRNTVGAYIGQQRGYGKAEALLYFRHPHRFNGLGHSRWQGRIYGGLSALLSLRRPVVYAGVFGRGLFQTLYQPPSSALSLLPFTLEWNALAVALLGEAVFKGGWAWLGALPLLVAWASCLAAAWRARVDPRAEGLRGRLLIAVLTYAGPLARALERYRWRIRGLTGAEPPVSDRPVQALPVSWRERAFSMSFWTEAGLEKESILHRLIEILSGRKYFVRVDRGWSDWDLEVHGGIWSRAHIKVCGEDHGQARRVLRVKCTLRTSPLTRITVVAAALLAALGVGLRVPGLTVAAAALGAVGAGAFLREGLTLGRMLYDAVQTVARRARLRYVPRVYDQPVEAQ
jgi:GT2 family glycosyltransferase